MSPHPATRVAFLVSKELRLADWEARFHGPFVASLVLSLAKKRTHFFNVYNDISATSEATTTPILHETRKAVAEALAERTDENEQEMAEKSVLLLGDFNLHHPNWGGDHIAADEKAETLIETVNLFGMELLLPRGTCTYARGPARTTIDLAFATPHLTQRLISCEPREDWGSGVDHHPILMRFDVQPWKTMPPERFALKKLNKKGLNSTLFLKLQQA
jgi:exonuclease III